MARGSRQPLWVRVYDAIHRDIDQGRLAPEDPIPPEHKLAELYGVSRVTIRTALNRLETEGLITAARGPLGRTVSSTERLYWRLSFFEVGPRRDDPDTGTDEWAADMQEQGRTPRQIVSVDELAPPRPIAEMLQVPQRTFLVRRRRLRLANEVPVSIADTWITEETANRTCMVGDQELQPFRHPHDLAVTGGIVAAIGYVQDHADDTIYSRHATREEAELLQIHSNDTVVTEHVRVGYDAEHHPLRVLRSVSPGSRLVLTYRLKFRNQGGNAG
ncbi:GntR family transcriptional regulator [Amycolatopsis sp.]|uniref:GntR family transcriptional regulator n=1 Tax=Amycolatopsis sp. TaxID=37632 RepID=UPI002D80F449|nr:GntR family transcriptional regulator [Amycolatopsis sp.]HET6711329.1 GntR family transcriptional regulator [Amycolatopsis sp.]